jgi:nucleoside-diphosphate-sugar epimerase
LKALVIGGTGPTGPHVLTGLLERGYEVTILHRGVHEPEGLPPVRHIHADPHFAETLVNALGDEKFDVVIAMYGRLRAIGEVFPGRCGHLICVSGVPLYRGFIDPQNSAPYGMKLMAHEDSPKADTANLASKSAMLILNAERFVFEQGEAGGFAVSSIRYPQIYGPRNIIPWEWAVVKRVLDGRRRMILPDNGLWIISRCAARNAAEVVLRIADHPEVAAGQAYNCADEDQFSVRQWAEIVAEMAGGGLEFIGIPASIARSSLTEFLPPGARPHMILSIDKAREELGYSDVISAWNALQETVDWMVRNPIEPADYPLYTAKFDYDLDDRLIDSYHRAASWVREQAPDEQPVIGHPMPHPKKPSLTVDERGR